MSDEGQFVSVQIFRFDLSVDAKPHYDTFRVPLDEEETILGVLKYVVKHHDPSLAFRESCRIGNCMACNVKVNGKGVVACRKTLKDFGGGKLVLDPVSEEKVIRDLVCTL
jgi:succinate dehydrogenase/fumarate reductase iron-sulfur protein